MNVKQRKMMMSVLDDATYRTYDNIAHMRFRAYALLPTVFAVFGVVFLLTTNFLSTILYIVPSTLFCVCNIYITNNKVAELYNNIYDYTQLKIDLRHLDPTHSQVKGE